MLGYVSDVILPNLKFLRLPVFKILQFKISRFSFSLVLPFMSIVAEDLLWESWLTFIEKQLILQF